jgi:hypothetical protein
VDAETLRASSRLTYVFEIPLESFRGPGRCRRRRRAQPSAEDIDKIKSLATGYVGMLRKYADPEASIR